MKRYYWNKRKFAENLTVLTVIVAAGMLIGYIFAMWAGGAA